VDVETLMARLARAGVTALIKADDERMSAGGEPWTVVFSGAALGAEGGVRSEAAELRSALAEALDRLAARPGEWSGLDEFRTPRPASVPDPPSRARHSGQAPGPE